MKKLIVAFAIAGLSVLPLSALSVWITEPYNTNLFVLVPGGQWTVPVGGYFNNDWTPTSGNSIIWRVFLNGTKGGPTNGNRIVLRLPNNYTLAANCVDSIALFTNGVKQNGLLQGYIGEQVVSLYANAGYGSGVLGVEFTAICEVQ